MGSNVRRICLITPGHLASTPRLLKEAEALVGAGYQVHVIAGRNFPPADSLDEAILAKAPWTCTRVDARDRGVLTRKLLRRFARTLILAAPFATVRTAAQAVHADTFRLAAAAAATPADLYLGHCLAGLPAAAFAAQERHARHGFDAEDFHDAETEAAIKDRSATTAARVLQGSLLRSCRHLTAASPLIGRQYTRAYDVEPAVVLNTFPLRHAPSAPVTPAPISSERPARFYWFSQTIGPGRGLEAMLPILARMQTPAELHLRGFVTTEFRAHFQRVATQAGLKRPVHFLPVGPADEMSRLAADADLGLSTELSTPLNRDLCLTNKIFVYLLAGLPQLLSATSAHQVLAPELGEAGLLGDLNQPAETARQLDGFFRDPARIARARQTAWRLAHERFCWEIEQQSFLASIEKALH